MEISIPPIPPETYAKLRVMPHAVFRNVVRGDYYSQGGGASGEVRWSSARVPHHTKKLIIIGFIRCLGGVGGLVPILYSFTFIYTFLCTNQNSPRSLKFSTSSTCGCQSPHKRCVFLRWSKVISLHLYSTKATSARQKFIFIIAVSRSVQLLCFERQTVIFIVLVTVSDNCQVGKG